jgi:hypothetical protein
MAVKKIKVINLGFLYKKSGWLCFFGLEKDN